MAAKIKKGDTVVVLAGSSKGQSGEVIAVMPKKNKALVRGINIVIRHQRQTESTKGGRIEKEAPIDLSNLTIADPQDGKPTRIGFRRQEDGTKIRYAKRSGELIDD